jgi:hypothetical protein
MPTFANYDEQSFRKTLSRWANDPLGNMISITILFAAIGYLKEHDILKVSTISIFMLINALLSATFHIQRQLYLYFTITMYIRT